MSFTVGQKVVCVNDRSGDFDIPGIPNSGIPLLVEIGERYIIRETSICPYDGRFCVRLRGIVRILDAWLDAGRFRPLCEDSMKLLRAIAADPKPLVEEPEYEGIPFTG